ncbi:T9SS type A sorting domain-containing protein [Patescibacteria group bacterium]|nr:T9SS type A sorting domain-containing protein [Patescibacteria group bacterium]
MIIIIAVVMIGTVSAQSIKIDWTHSISGMEITGVASIGSDIYTVSITSSITEPGFTYEVHKWDAAGTSSKIANGTTNTTPHIIATESSLLIYTVQSEPVKIINATGTIIVEKTLPATLQLTNLYEAQTTYFFANNTIVRATVGQEHASGNVATRIQTIDSDLNITETIDLDDFECVSIVGSFIIGNEANKGQIIDITATLTDVELSSTITSATIHNNELYVVSSNKLYKYDANLTEVWNKSISGTSLHFISDHPVTINGNSIALYKDDFSSQIATLSVPISIANMSETSDALLLAGKSLVKVIYSTSGVGVEELTNENSIVLYPNPCTTHISIKGTSNSEVEIVDMLGTTVIRSTKNTIDVDSLPTGVYSCKVGKSVIRFIKK